CRRIGRGRPAEPQEDLRTGDRQALAGADEEGDPLPTPRMDLQPQGRERFGLRIRGHSRFRSVSTELTAHEGVRVNWWGGVYNFDLFIANGLTIHADRRLHR